MRKELELLHKEICEKYSITDEQWFEVWNTVCSKEAAEPKSRFTRRKHRLCEFIPQLTSNNVVGVRTTYARIKEGT